MMAISVIANVTFSGCFFILISLTSPVLSSVAALLPIFIVAIVDWLLTNKALSPGAIIGGLLIIRAFILLTWSMFKEMEDSRRNGEVDIVEIDESDKDDEP
jgi:drug/metabolite transporter (DMT)-like permease